MVEQRSEQALGDEQLPPQDWVRRYVPGMVTEAAPAEMVDEITALMCDVHPAADVTALRGMAERISETSFLPRIDVATLLLYGEVDKRSPLTVATELHAQIPNSTLVVLPGVGHLSNVEAADSFNREVHSLLRARQQ